MLMPGPHKILTPPALRATEPVGRRRRSRTHRRGLAHGPSLAVRMCLFVVLCAWTFPLAGDLNAQAPVAAQAPAAGQAPAVTQAAAVESAEPQATAIVVCPKAFRSEIGPWVDYRNSQGVAVRVIDSADSADRLAEMIREAASATDRFLFLVGDAPVIGSPADPDTEVPMHYVATTVSAKFGSTPTMATDYP